MKNFESLFAAYMAVWAIFMIYHFTIARRVARVEGELRDLKSQMSRRG